MSYKCSFTSSSADLDEISSIGSVDDGTSEIIDDPVYAEYKFDIRMGNNLPIHSYRDKILKILDSHSVIVLQGATGCGKTTQVPQFLLDQAYARKERCNIVVTQPRRIAAISNAERVANERNWPLKTVVGYQVGSKSRL